MGQSRGVTELRAGSDYPGSLSLLLCPSRSRVGGGREEGLAHLGIAEVEVSASEWTKGDSQSPTRMVDTR